MEKLYTQYGELMIQLEVIQARINVVKQQIAQELNKKVEPIAEPVVKV